ncbi:phosphonopyruvate decarboxylase [Lichenicoccus roseus]|uniref:Phosphonopyruvate decarboxylase n=1 Tax=Lichenicoccus roseus TaxID=2683649 RepID=A0A5R9JBZ0_9PROT|nr:phosphonopyruvate decarboxylase [Lichenicoccus roseus]TLU71808.1 phosphonopyruvate decarboxylase [Lichenicoccus roseus]
MLEASAFINASAARGLDFWSGVPCSFLTPLINRVASSAGAGLDYVGAASEGEAVAIAAGAWLGGRGGVVICQNSGLGNAVNPLTSLNHPFRIPLLMVVTWRGQPGIPDEPQHALMGRITQDLLSLCEVPSLPFPARDDAIAPALAAAQARFESDSLPFALVMEQGSVADETLSEPSRPQRQRGLHYDLRAYGDRPPRIALLERMLALLPGQAAVIATTGKSGRELFTLDDRAQHLYQVGSMGGASGMALGVAMTRPERRVVVLDGDGAALMKLGTLATIGAQHPPNLLHVLLDNGVHDSTGGQSTVSASVDFAGVALACGYAAAWSVDDASGFDQAMRAALDFEGPVLVHARIAPGSIKALGRPTVAPHEVARRFRAFLLDDPVTRAR